MKYISRIFSSSTKSISLSFLWPWACQSEKQGQNQLIMGKTNYENYIKVILFKRYWLSVDKLDEIQKWMIKR